MLRTFAIHGFKCFDALTVDGLAATNLVVGRNNAGKSAFLEALWLLARGGDPHAIAGLLDRRDESADPGSIFCRHAPGGVRLQSGGATVEMLRGFAEPGQRWIDDPPERFGRSHGFDSEPAMAIRDSAEQAAPGHARQWQVVRFAEFHDLAGRRPLAAGRGILIAPSDAMWPRLGEWWDRVALTPAEQSVLELLRLAAPVEALSFVNLNGNGHRVPMVRLQGTPAPVPLASVGDGARWLLQVGLALMVAGAGDLVLIDEIDVGLHFSVLPPLWQQVFAAARDRKVQVFATTHSWECVEGLREAMQQTGSRDCALFSLRRHVDEPARIAVESYSADELAVVVRDGVEVR